MAQTVHLDTKYGKKIDQQFTIGSLIKGRLNKEEDFVGARTVRIHNINTVPLNDYKREGTARYGETVEVGDNVQELYMSQDKSFSAAIDKGNNMDQAINKAGKFLKVQMDEAVVPAYDRYCFAALAGKAGVIVGDTAAIDDTTAMKRLMKARAALKNARVPVQGRTLYVTSDLLNSIWESKHFTQLEKLGASAIINGQQGSIFGSPVVEVPADLLPEGVNFIWMHKRAACAPEKIADTKLHIDPPGISGNLCEGRFYYDAFVYGAKAAGIYVDVTTGANVKVLAVPTIAAATGAITGASGATVKYTTDGSDPRYSITAQEGKTPTVTAGDIVKAYQFQAGAFASPVATVTVTG